MADDIRSLSAALARDPASLQYVDLAEALRKRGNLTEALQAVTHGLTRHSEHADGYDCLARIHSDMGHLPEARSAWERVLAIVPEHTGALKGIAFLYYRQGDTKRATDALEHALAADPHDLAAQRALAMVTGQSPPPEQPHHSRTTQPVDVPQLRATASAMLADSFAAAEQEAPAPAAPAAAPTPSVPAAAADRPPVFAGLEGATNDILLLDARGLVMAGGLRTAGGSDVSELAAAALAGVSGEATRTSGYLNLGTWTSIVAEAEHANVILAPVGEGALLLLRRERSTPVGLAARIAERARATAAQWLAAQT